MKCNSHITISITGSLTLVSIHIFLYVLYSWENLAAVMFGESGWMKILAKSLANEEISQKITTN